jgi:hypothetical protein
MDSWTSWGINPLNADLNPICHLLVLLGDLTFMDPCILSIFQYISNKIQRYTIYLYLETALHVSGAISTHHQERIQLYLHHLVTVTPYCFLLLSWKSWNRFECAVGDVHHPQHTQTGSNSSTIAAGISNGVTNTRCCRYSLYAPDDGWKLCNIASCWINIGILLGAHYILHISRIRVKFLSTTGCKTIQEFPHRTTSENSLQLFIIL